MLCGLNAGLAAAEIQHDLENIEPHDTHARPTSSSTKPLDCGQQQCGRPLHENENVDNRPPRQLESRHPPNSRVFRQLPVSLGSQLAALGEEEDDTPGILHTPDITPRRPTSRARREEQRGVELRSDPLSTSSPSTEAPSIFSGRWEAVLMVDNREHECMAVQVNVHILSHDIPWYKYSSVAHVTIQQSSYCVSTFVACWLILYMCTLV